MILGVISDTHGKMSDSVLDIFAGCDAILHAGDIGSADIIERLGSIALVHAILGNCDLTDYGLGLSTWAKPVFAKVQFCIVHDPADIRYVRDGCSVAVFGHTHLPRNEQAGGLLYFNPGSATRPHGGFPSSVGRIEVKDGDVVSSEIIAIETLARLV